LQTDAPHPIHPQLVPAGAKLEMNDAFRMGLTHCPLCVALAVFSAVRFSAHAVLLWQLIRPAPTATSALPSHLRWQGV